MKKQLSVFCIIIAAALLGFMPNLYAAGSTADSQSGPGMTEGYGPGYGMGHGMMGGHGHNCDMGSGMMGGYGSGYGMGYGGYASGYGMGRMMGESLRGLGLSKEQSSKIINIRHEMRTKQWTLMGQMMDARDKLQELYDADKEDAAAINKQYKVIDDLRSQMVDNSVDAHNRINDILTKEQREKYREWGHGYGPMMQGY